MEPRLEFKIINYQPCSTNDAYIPTAKRGNKRYRGAYFRKSSELIAWQEFINRAFEVEHFCTSAELEEFSSYLEENDMYINFELFISMPKDVFFTRDQNDLRALDASNYIKSIEDTIANGIGVDDKYNLRVTSNKSYNEDGVWYLKIVLTPIKLERLDVDIERAYFKEE